MTRIFYIAVHGVGFNFLNSLKLFMTVLCLVCLNATCWLLQVLMQYRHCYHLLYITTLCFFSLFVFFLSFSFFFLFLWIKKVGLHLKALCLSFVPPSSSSHLWSEEKRGRGPSVRPSSAYCLLVHQKCWDSKLWKLVWLWNDQNSRDGRQLLSCLETQHNIGAVGVLGPLHWGPTWWRTQHKNCNCTDIDHRFNVVALVQVKVTKWTVFGLWNKNVCSSSVISINKGFVDYTEVLV